MESGNGAHRDREEGMNSERDSIMSSSLSLKIIKSTL